MFTINFWFRQRKNFKNRPTFAKVTIKIKVAQFFMVHSVFGLGWHTWHHLPQVHLSFSVRHHFFHSDLCSMKIVKLMLLLTRQVETRWPDSYRFSWLLKPASSYLAKGLQHLSRHFWQVKDVLATSYCTFTFVMSYPSLLFFTMHEV